MPSFGLIQSATAVAFIFALVACLLFMRTGLPSSPAGVKVAPSIWLPDVAAVMPILRRHAQLVNSFSGRPHCPLVQAGKGWGSHKLCNTPPTHPCVFYSFGISNDYSFDTFMDSEWHCTGIACDPTITHPSKLGNNVYFLNAGAKMLSDADNQQFAMVTSMPNLRRWLGHSHVDVLKMDCEGCEYSLPRDVLAEDPEFFHRVGQFAVEVHVCKFWINTPEVLYAFGMLLKLLDEAGLVLQDPGIETCRVDQEATGCIPELVDIGLPCGNGQSCHNYLFARPTSATQP